MDNRLVDEKGQYTELGKAVSDQITKVMHPIIHFLLKEGNSVAEINYILDGLKSEVLFEALYRSGE